MADYRDRSRDEKGFRRAGGRPGPEEDYAGYGDDDAGYGYRNDDGGYGYGNDDAGYGDDDAGYGYGNDGAGYGYGDGGDREAGPGREQAGARRGPSGPARRKAAGEPRPAEEGGWARRRRSRRRWRRFLLIYTAAFLLLGAGGCFGLYRYLDAYEQARPEHVMDQLMAETDPAEWYAYARAGMDLPVSEFEDPEALFQEYYDAVLRDAAYTYRKSTAGGEDGTERFVIRAGASDLCEVTLTPREGSGLGFGFHLWDVGEIRSCFAMKGLESVALEIDAPPEAEVFINGVALGQAYQTGEIPCPGLTELESRFETVPHYVRYRVDAMYGAVSVTDGQGRELAPEEESAEGLVRYVVPPAETYSFTVRAPEGVTVSVCGAQLDPAEAVSSGPGILEGLEAYLGQGEGYDTLTYTFSGLYTQPEITAWDGGGNQLRPLLCKDGALVYFLPQDDGLRQEQLARVEEFFNAYITYSASAYTQENYYALLGCILPDTELYAYVRDSVDAMIWASATQVHYDELSFEDFVAAGENCFTCTVRYKADFSATAWYESYTYDLENAYELAFVCRDGVWYAAAMAAVEG